MKFIANPIGFTFISCTCGLHVEFHLPISILISPVRKYKYKLREDSMSWICVHLTALKKAMMYNVYLMEFQSLVDSSVRQISLKYLLCSSYSVSSCNFYMFKISSCSFTWVSNSTFLFFVEYHMHVECENFKSWFLCICISTCLGQYVAVKFSVQYMY